VQEEVHSSYHHMLEPFVVEPCMPIDLVGIPSNPAFVVLKAFLEAYTAAAFLDLLDSLVEQ